MQPRGHQEVARAFRRRCRQDRRLEFGEARRPHALAHRTDDARARHDVLVQRLAAQVEETVGQADVFGIVRLVEDRQRQLARRAQHFDIADEDLDRAGRQRLVDRLRRAHLHVAVDAQAPFGAHRLGKLERGRIGVDHALRHAVVVAQVDEEQAAVIAHAVHPARQARGGADMGFAQFPARVTAIAMHVVLDGPKFEKSGG